MILSLVLAALSSVNAQVNKQDCGSCGVCSSFFSSTRDLEISQRNRDRLAYRNVFCVGCFAHNNNYSVWVLWESAGWRRHSAVRCCLNSSRSVARGDLCVAALASVGCFALNYVSFYCGVALGLPGFRLPRSTKRVSRCGSRSRFLFALLRSGFCASNP
jgi:hypothetical protein